MQRNIKSTLFITLASLFVTVTVLLGGCSKPEDIESVPLSSEVISSEEESSEEISSEEVSSEETVTEPEKIELDVTAPKKDITVYVDWVLVKGRADPAQPLYINDAEIEKDENGIFAHKMP